VTENVAALIEKREKPTVPGSALASRQETWKKKAGGNSAMKRVSQGKGGRCPRPATGRGKQGRKGGGHKKLRTRLTVMLERTCARSNVREGDK